MKENNEVYEDPKEMSAVLNHNFQKVFTAESDFKKSQVRKNEMWEIKIIIRRDRRNDKEIG